MVTRDRAKKIKEQGRRGIVKHGRTPEAQAAANKQARFERSEIRAGRSGASTSEFAKTGTPQDITRGLTQPQKVSQAIQQAKGAKSLKSEMPKPAQAQPEGTPEGAQEAFQLEQPILDEQGQPILKTLEEQEQIDNLKLNMDPEFAAERAGARPNPTALEVGAVVAATGVTAAVAVAAAEALLVAAGFGLAPIVSRTTMGLAPKNIWKVSPSGAVELSTVGKELVVRQAATVGGKVPGGTRIFPSGEPAWAVGRAGVSRVATNPITAERTRVFIGKLFPKGFKQKLYASLVLTTLGTWIPAVGIGYWGKNEGLDGLTFARDKAITEGNLSLAEEIKKDIDIVSNESIWRQVGGVLPVTAIPISILRMNDKRKGNEKWNTLLDEKVIRLQEGRLTPEEAKFERIRTEKTEAGEETSADIAARDARIKAEQEARDAEFAERREPTQEEITAGLHKELFTR